MIAASAMNLLCGALFLILALAALFKKLHDMKQADADDEEPEA